MPKDRVSVDLNGGRTNSRSGRFLFVRKERGPVTDPSSTRMNAFVIYLF